MAVPTPEVADESNETAKGGDSLVVSLLTCAPGTESYALYGHTALRAVNATTGDDWVFNYGIFSFAQPHFIWRFMLGQTDYTVAAEPMQHFAETYAAEGRSITEQRLNLSQEEARRLLRAIKENVLTDGWTYRYNFLKDNCTSRVVSMIAQSLNGRLQLPDVPPTTHRDIIHSYAAEVSPWNNFGQDLILGADVDTVVSTNGCMAFPLLAEDILQEAVITDSAGNKRPLVLSRTQVVSAEAPATDRFPISPMVAAILVLCLAIGVSVPNFRGNAHKDNTAASAQKKHGAMAGRLFDDAAMLLQGLAGCLIFLLFFFSEQPAVGSNWLFALLNPIPLICLPIKLWREHKGKDDFYIPLVQLLLLVIFLLTSFLQKYPAEIYVLALALLVRSLSTRHALRK